MAQNGDFGARLGEILDTLGVSAEELGRRMGYATKGRLIRKWKNEGTAPGSKSVHRMAEALRIPAATFFEPVGAAIPRPATPLSEGPVRPIDEEIRPSQDQRPRKQRNGEDG